MGLYNKIASKMYGLLLLSLKNMQRNIKSDKSYFVSKTKELLKEEKTILIHILDYL